MRKSRMNNKGYSLVELVIVLAIILILATMSLISLTILKTARAKDSCITTGEEINALKMRSMNMSPNDGIHDKFGLSIYKDSNDIYHVAQIQHNSTTGDYDYVVGENIKLSSAIDIKFTGELESQTSAVTDYVPGNKNGTGSDSPIIILFDKRGNCYSGAGTISFYKKNGNRVSRIEIKSSGSVDIR